MTHTLKRMALAAIIPALMLAAGAAQAAEPATVSTATKAPYGTYLVDAEGRTLYLFKADVQGKKSVCHDTCAKLWPPLLTQGAPVATGKADADLLGTIQRDNGTTQVTYNGWPLYYFVKDKEPGDTTGQDVHGFGGEWYLVSPQGTIVHAEQSGDSDSGGGYH